jgi:hypothetical protein
VPESHAQRLVSDAIGEGRIRPHMAATWQTLIERDPNAEAALAWLPRESAVHLHPIGHAGGSGTESAADVAYRELYP